MGITAHGADVIVVAFTFFAQILEGSAVQLFVDLFDFVGIVEGAQGFLIPFGFSILDEGRIHFAVFVMLARNCGLEVFFGGFDLTGGTEVIVSMTILVWKTVARGKAWGYPLAVLYHTVLDGASVWLSTLGLTSWELEGCLSIFFVVSVVLIWRFWVGEKKTAAAEPAAPDPVVPAA